jgi:hypothetical protein
MLLEQQFTFSWQTKAYYATAEEGRMTKLVYKHTNRARVKSI